MTNNEYEKACVEAATGQAWLKGADEMIERLEKQLAEWQEYRRELINRFNLNKCEHEFDYNPKDMCGQCIKCGVQRHA